MSSHPFKPGWTPLDDHDAAGFTRHADFDTLQWANPHPNPDPVRKQRDDLVLFLLRWFDDGPEHDALDLKEEIQELLSDACGFNFEHLGVDSSIYDIIAYLKGYGILPPWDEDEETCVKPVSYPHSFDTVATLDDVKVFIQHFLETEIRPRLFAANTGDADSVQGKDLSDVFSRVDALDLETGSLDAIMIAEFLMIIDMLNRRIASKADQVLYPEKIVETAWTYLNDTERMKVRHCCLQLGIDPDDKLYPKKHEAV